MNQFSVLLQKEWRENIRNYKVFWIPVVFILFGIIEPVTQYFLPQILESAGNVPEEVVAGFPVPAPEEILISVMGQYQFMGLLILILAYMGSVSGERKSGTATLLYVRPLSYPAYFISKWVMAGAVALVSIWLGFFASYYYIWLLFDAVDMGQTVQFTATYSLWILLIVSIILAASAALPGPGLTAAAVLVLIFIAQIIDGLLGAYWNVSPLKLPAYAGSWLIEAPDLSDFWWSAGITAVLIALLVAFGVWLSHRNAAKTKV
ncbi:ABC transporter permease [Planococcus lenghuensis]|uniref:ABC transporter permease n=1 Tax=Planococcus lenghuensis TaxID=2213202 RepID=A0A1Q2L1Y2_9BACL|nr:ABC transporter permease subunit [Planococcus lenghuensis]AQQ54449.1 ABC transporter permease [Planococcus lenghuensis]